MNVPVYVNGTTGTTGTTPTTSLVVSYTPQPGNYICIAINFFGGIPTTVSCVDQNGSNLPASTLNGSTANLFKFIGVMTPGTTQYTISWTGGSFTANMCLAEYDNTGQQGIGSSTSGTTSPMSIGLASGANLWSLYVACFGDSRNTTFTINQGNMRQVANGTSGLQSAVCIADIMNYASAFSIKVNSSNPGTWSASFTELPQILNTVTEFGDSEQFGSDGSNT